MKISGTIAIAVIILAGRTAYADDVRSHVAEIKLFATTMAIAKTVQESCRDLVVDDRFLEALRQRLHIVDSDHSAFATKARAAADELQRARDEAPSRQAWCGAIFRLYGPDGKLMHGMLGR